MIPGSPTYAGRSETWIRSLGQRLLPVLPSEIRPVARKLILEFSEAVVGESGSLLKS